MKSPDTTIGEGSSSFPSTVWSDVLAAADPRDPTVRGALDHLLRRYWRPVYAYVRTAFRKSAEDAKDLTQGFFAHLLEASFFEKADPKKGSFRGFVKRALRNFVIDRERADASRRPRSPVLSLDIALDVSELAPASKDEAPEAAYDREWFRCLLDAAVDELWEHLCLEGKLKQFEVFDLYCLQPARAPGDPGTGAAGLPTYRDVAAKLKMSESEVGHALEDCRAELKRILVNRIREYTSSPEDVEAELKLAFGGGA